jgi:flagellar FliL protein
MKKKALIPILAIVIVGAGAAYTMAKPKPKFHDRIQGTVYVLPKDFLLNLSDGRYAKLTVALVLAPGQSAGGTAAEGGTPPPEGFGTLPEEPAVRDIVTNIVTNQGGDTLISPSGRQGIKRQILQAILKSTDVKITQVLLTDVAVQ